MIGHRDLLPGLVLPDGRRTLGGVHDHRQRRPLSHAEEHSRRALDEADHQYLHVGDVRRPAGHRDAPDRGQPDRVTGDHEPLAVIPVGQTPARQREQQVAEHGRETGDPRLGRRAGHGQNQQRVGDLGRLRAEQRDRLAAPQQLEIPVTPQRHRPQGLHAPTLCAL
jgi:hypothetical protein